MNTFKQKSLYAALAGLGALGATGAAQAVNVNPDGLGQVLIYPYYTTRSDAAGNTYNSLLSVVNSTASAKAVKVRFLEGKNSREVLDFNLFLSAYDVWTAAILPSTGGGGARVGTTDRSCTLPAIPAGGQDFVNFAYGSGSANDQGGATLDRTREGYVEIIEMGYIIDNSTTYNQITHVNGVPPGCASVTDSQAAADTSFLTGGLFGGLTLINVGAGTDYTEDAVALDNFYSLPQNLYFPAGSTAPDLSLASPPVATVFTSNSSGTPGVVQSTFGGASGGINAVSAVLMHNNILNEFVLDPGTKSGTDWVITMPTKRFYVSAGTGAASGGLFQRNFNGTAGSCDDVSLNIYDREERTTSTPLTFSPPPPQGVNQLCWEANVVTFNNSNVLNSTNTANIQTTFQNGWLRIGFFPATVTGQVHRLTTSTSTFTPVPGTTGATAAATYFGLPVVGFAVQNFSNGNLTVGGVTIGQNYGGNFMHKYTRLIQ
ncbi:MAG: hypothetical protein M3Z31_15850 [Pseudomonadota bacterium]|nr:hypothetical protein [Pseudomonadota bacterium]